MDQTAALRALAALANETRLSLLRGLIAEGPEGVAAGQIAARLDISPSRLSFHLSALEQAGLVQPRRAARHVFYAADTARLGALMNYLLNDCCHAHPEVSACCHTAATEPGQG